MRVLKLAPSADLSEQNAGRKLVAMNAGSDGEVYLVYAKPPLAYRTSVSPSSASHAVTQPPQPQSYRVVSVQDGSVELDVTINDERFNIHHIQPLEDQLLLVCGRAHYSLSGQHEHNGRIYSRSGTFAGEILLGDGIQDVQTTANGTIWTSYFDEGVFGNFGWDEPLGSAGLVAWDRKGQKVLEYKPVDELDSICDCYALNVESNDDVWLCYYTDFPLVHLRNGRVHRYWRAPVAGSMAFAVDPHHCLFQGGYDDRDTFVLAELNNTETPRIITQFRLQDEAANPISFSYTAGRRDQIHLMAGTRLYNVDIATSLTAV